MSLKSLRSIKLKLLIAGIILSIFFISQGILAILAVKLSSETNTQNRIILQELRADELLFIHVRLKLFQLLGTVKPEEQKDLERDIDNGLKDMGKVVVSRGLDSQTWTSYQNSSAEIIKLQGSFRTKKAYEMMNGPHYEQQNILNLGLEEEIKKVIENSDGQAFRLLRKIMWITSAFCIFSLGILCALILLARCRVLNPVVKVGKALEKVAAGDLSVRVNYHSDDEVGTMSISFDNTMASLQDVIGKVSSHAHELALEAVTLGNASRELVNQSQVSSHQTGVVKIAAEAASRGVQALAASTEEMRASNNELAQATGESAKKSHEAAILAQNSDAAVARLSQASDKIGAVAKTIAAIADQTNLLALNATIESARAGEAGRGFAVVANEVKLLAKKTSEATNDISNRISMVQMETQKTACEIQQIATAMLGAQNMQKTIVSAIEEQAATTTGMTARASEAARGSSDIVNSMGALATSTQVTDKIAISMKGSSEKLERLSQDLRAAVSRITNDTIHSSTQSG